MEEYQIGWTDYQLELLDDYIMGYSTFENQEALAEAIGKSLNAVKVKLSRRKLDVKQAEIREITPQEYILFLSNRFDKETTEIAKIIGIRTEHLLEELDELDCLECAESLEKGYEKRPLTADEVNTFLRLYNNKKRNAFQIAHILNRPIQYIREMIEVYGKQASQV